MQHLDVQSLVQPSEASKSDGAEISDSRGFGFPKSDDVKHVGNGFRRHGSEYFKILLHLQCKAFFQTRALCFLSFSDGDALPNAPCCALRYARVKRRLEILYCRVLFWAETEGLVMKQSSSMTSKHDIKENETFQILKFPCQVV